MTKLQISLNLFPVNFLKELITLKMNNIMKYPMNLEEFIPWLGCWFYMGCWVRISNRGNWWLTTELNMSEGDSFRINKYM